MFNDVPPQEIRSGEKQEASQKATENALYNLAINVTSGSETQQQTQTTFIQPEFSTVSKNKSPEKEDRIIYILSTSYMKKDLEGRAPQRVTAVAQSMFYDKTYGYRYAIQMMVPIVQNSQLPFQLPVIYVIDGYEFDPRSGVYKLKRTIVDGDGNYPDYLGIQYKRSGLFAPPIRS